MRFALSTLAVFAALPGAMPARAQSALPEETTEDVTADAAKIEAIIGPMVNDIYQDSGLINYVYGSAVNQGSDNPNCRSSLNDFASEELFRQMSGVDRSVVIMALCENGNPGKAGQSRTDGMAPFAVIDVNDLQSSVNGWGALGEQRQGWWMDYVRDHERAHTTFNRDAFSLALSGVPRHWQYEELAPDLTALCLAWADTDNPMRGPWVESNVLAMRVRDAGSSTHGFYGDLLIFSISNFTAQCQEMGAITLDPNARRAAASRLALRNTLSLALPRAGR